MYFLKRSSHASTRFDCCRRALHLLLSDEMEQRQTSSSPLENGNHHLANDRAVSLVFEVASSVSNQRLMGFFGKYYGFRSVWLVTDRAGYPQCYAKAVFVGIDAATALMRTVNGVYLQGMPLNLRLKIELDEPNNEFSRSVEPRTSNSSWRRDCKEYV